MHEIHAEGQLRHFSHHCRRLAFLGFYASKQQEEAEGGTQHIGRAELPAPLQQRRLDRLAGNSLPPERPSRKGSSDEKEQRAEAQAALARPLQVHADVVSHDKVA